MLAVMTTSFAQHAPVRLGVVGLTHSHVHWILGSPKSDAYQIVGIVEPNTDLAERYAKQYKFSMDMVYPTLEAMIKDTSPHAVTAFGTIYEHLEVVDTCAPKGIHIMVEKLLGILLCKNPLTC